jgi:hypothetical protein
MPIAIKNSIIDISSEETTKELAKKLFQLSERWGSNFFIWRNGSGQNYLCKIFD